MVLRRRVPTVKNPELSRGFQGRQKVLAAIVQAALRRAGYEAYFLGGTERPGLCIGTHGADAVGVSNIKNPAGFTWKNAQNCAEKLNDQLKKIVPSANALAIPRRDTTSIGSVPYAEVVVRCPNDSVLRALHKGLVK